MNMNQLQEKKCQMIYLLYLNDVGYILKNQKKN